MNGSSWTLTNVSSEMFKPSSFPRHISLSSLISSIGSKSVLLPLASTVFFLFFFVSSFSSPPKVDAPIVGYRSVFEPTLLLRLRFLFGARDIIRNGYTKVNSVALTRLTLLNEYSIKMPSSMSDA